MQHVVEVENIKCGGCANSILSKLNTIKGVDQVNVSIELGEVSFVGSDESKQAVEMMLHSLGYPVKGSVSGLSSVGAKAKSFVSCAIGKVSKE